MGNYEFRPADSAHGIPQPWGTHPVRPWTPGEEKVWVDYVNAVYDAEHVSADEVEHDDNRVSFMAEHETDLEEGLYGQSS